MHTPLFFLTPDPLLTLNVTWEEIPGPIVDTVDIQNT